MASYKLLLRNDNILVCLCTRATVRAYYVTKKGCIAI